MRKRVQLYKPVDFFKLQKVKFIQRVKQPPGSLSLRHLSAIDDMDTINHWRTDPEIKSNFPTPKNPPYLIKHYFSIMRSSSSQAFIILWEDKPICILDIILARASSLTGSILCFPEDGILEYLFRTSAKTNIDFRDVLGLFRDYYFSFEGRGRLILPLKDGDVPAIQTAEILGFREISRALLSDSLFTIYCFP